MTTLHIIADVPERRSIKRKAHLFCLLAVLTGAAGGVCAVWADGPLNVVFWCLMVAALVSGAVSVLFWVSERPKETNLFGSIGRRPRKMIE
ncbi:MAG: hypothetical protein AB9869_09935 [Verrucomicrobiia bacterium]